MERENTMITNTAPQSVAKTHWATVEPLNNLAESLQGVFNTDMELWQKRVDTKGQVPHVPHSYLYPVTALEYAIQDRDGQKINAPVEPRHELTFLVLAESNRDACEKVWKQLEAHGWQKHQWAVWLTTACLVLS